MKYLDPQKQQHIAIEVKSGMATPQVHFCMPYMARMHRGMVHTKAPKIQNFVEFAVCRQLFACRSNSIYESS